MLTTACAQWAAPVTSFTVTGTDHGEVVSNPGTVATEGVVLDTGVFEVALSREHACTRDVIERRRIRDRSERQLTKAGWASIGWGVFVPVGALGANAIAESGEKGSGSDALLAGGLVVGAVLVAVPLVSRFARTSRTVERDERVVVGTEIVACPSGSAHPLPTPLTVRTPWGAELTAPVDEHSRARFEVDWVATGIDPLSADATALMSRPWILRGPDGAQMTTWTPDDRDVGAMLVLVGDRTDTQVVVREGGLAPRLAVAAFGVGGVRSGEEVDVSLTVRNRGKGAAFRVVVSTHSGLPALRGLRFSFGLIEPGASKTKTIRVRLKPQRRDSREAVVLRFDEATGRGPAEITRPLEVNKARAPTLALDCELELVVIDPGTSSDVRCAVRNGGEVAARGVQMTATLNGAAPALSSKVDVHPGATAQLSVRVAVPATAQLDDVLAVAVVVTAANARGATWSAKARAGKPPICATRISQAEYEQRRERLRKALYVGALDNAEYDDAHAQLVKCLTAE